jgi:hypothetical protein
MKLHNLARIRSGRTFSAIIGSGNVRPPHEAYREWYGPRMNGLGSFGQDAINAQTFESQVVQQLSTIADAQRPQGYAAWLGLAAVGLMVAGALMGGR